MRRGSGLFCTFHNWDGDHNCGNLLGIVSNYCRDARSMTVSSMKSSKGQGLHLQPLHLALTNNATLLPFAAGLNSSTAAPVTVVDEKVVVAEVVRVLLVALNGQTLVWGRTHRAFRYYLISSQNLFGILRLFPGDQILTPNNSHEKITSSWDHVQRMLMAVSTLSQQDAWQPWWSLSLYLNGL